MTRRASNKLRLPIYRIGKTESYTLEGIGGFLTAKTNFYTSVDLVKNETNQHFYIGCVPTIRNPIFGLTKTVIKELGLSEDREANLAM